MSNMKGYELSIGTLWFIQFEGLESFNRHFFGIYITTYLVYTYIYITQNKLETQCFVSYSFPQKTNK